VKGFVHATHPATGGETMFPDDPSVLAAQKARGWVVSDEVPEELNPDAPNRGTLPGPDIPAVPAEAPADDGPEAAIVTEAPPAAAGKSANPKEK